MVPEFKLSLVPKLKVWTKFEIEAAISERTLFFVRTTKKGEFWFRIVNYLQHQRVVFVTKIPDLNNPNDTGNEPEEVSVDSIIYVIDQWPGYLKTKRIS